MQHHFIRFSSLAGQSIMEADEHAARIEGGVNFFHQRIHIILIKVERCACPNQIVSVANGIVGIVAAQNIHPILEFIFFYKGLGYLNDCRLVKDDSLHIGVRGHNGDAIDTRAAAQIQHSSQKRETPGAPR